MTARGFTLFELLVVLVVIGLLFTVATPLIGRGVPSLEVRSAAREIAAGMRRARSDAIFANREVPFTLDTEEKRYAIGDDGAWHALPDHLALEVETARSEVVDEAVAGVRFYPDGSATGGRVTVSGKSHQYHVMLDWLTGAVTVVE